MLHNFKDIIDAAGRDPLWWDENGTPRFCEFNPNKNANIYADEIVLLRVACQGCATEFDVCMSTSIMERYMHQHTWGRPGPSLAQLIEKHEIHYGDPPNTGCCPAGATMNSVPRMVLQYWTRDPSTMIEKMRVADYELEVTPDWA